MKVIDLLNKIANGEKVPKKIRYNEHNYYFIDGLYIDCEDETKTFKYAFNFYYLEKSLLKEVEILDEQEINKHTIHISNDNFTGIKMYQDGNEIMSMDYSTEEEDKDIPLIPDDELWIMNKRKGIYTDGKFGIDGDTALNHNFKVLQQKINQVVEEFNEYRKENE